MDRFEGANDASEGSATQRAYRALRAMIVKGDIRPGDKLKIDGMRGLLDTGASPIREALSLLTSDNLVERFDQRGFRAAEISAGNFSDILELRCVLEDLALRRSMANHSQEWEEAAVLAHHRMRQARLTGQDAFEDLHKAFHMSLLANADSPILLKFCSQLYDLNIRYRLLAGSALSYQERDVSEEHEGILAAAVAGDVNAASERLLSHYRLTGAFLSGLLGSGTLG